MSRLLLVALIICLTGGEPVWSDDLVKDSSLDADAQSTETQAAVEPSAKVDESKILPVSRPADNAKVAAPIKQLFKASSPKPVNECVAREAKASETSKGPKFHGMADYYHHSMYGNKTASGKVLHKHLKTAAHRTLPFGTRVRVTNKSNAKSCVVVVNDRGPFTPSKIIDLSHAAAVELGMLKAGTCKVTCEVLD